MRKWFYCDLESLEFWKVHFDHICGVEMTCVVLVFLRNESSFKCLSVSGLRGVCFYELCFKRVWNSIFGNFIFGNDIFPGCRKN